MNWIHNPSNLQIWQVIGVALCVGGLGMAYGIMIGKSAQRRFDKWFYDHGPRPWWTKG